MSTKYSKTTPIVITPKDQDKIRLVAEKESKFKICSQNGDPIILELAPSSKQLCDGLEAFGLKHPAEGKPFCLSIKLDGQDGSAVIAFLTGLENQFKVVSQQELQPTVYYPVDRITGEVDTSKSPTFTTKIRYFGDANSSQGLFVYSKNEVIKQILQELRNNFLGVYYIALGNITKASNGNWYLNTSLEQCIVHKRKVQLGTDYLQ